MNTRLSSTLHPSRLSLSALGILVLTCIGGPASALAQSAMQADVPFGFQAGATQQVAGQYLITTESSGLVKLTNGTTGQTNFILSTPSDSWAKTGVKSHMTFERVGDTYLLVAIRKPLAELRIPPAHERKRREAAGHNRGETIAQLEVPLR